MPRPTVRASELPPEVLKQLGLKLPRKTSFIKESVRSWSLKCLAMMAELSQDQRRRVLEHAAKLNRV
jgi:hypothetical protein